MSESPKPAAVFGLFTLTALVIANMIGAGVFTTSGFALADLHHPGRVLVAWVVGGGIALCGAVAYGTLARHLTESGGEYLFLARLVHPAVGFLAGWVSLLAGFTGAIAFAAVTFEVYVLPDRMRPVWLGEGWLATSAIVLTAVLHGLRRRAGALSQNAAVGIKLLLLLGFLIYAGLRMRSGTWQGGASISGESPQYGLEALISFAGALMWISLSFAGFNAAVYVAGESKHASHTVPKALWLGTVSVTLLYVALNAVFLYAPAPEQIVGQPDVAVKAAESLGGEPLVALVRATIALALLTSVSAMVVAGPRVYARMADDGLFPRSLRFDGEAPRAAIALQAALAITIVWIASLRELLSYLGFTLSLTSALAATSVFVLKRQGKAHIAAYQLGAAMIYVTATLAVATLGAIRNPWECLAGFLTLISGFAAFHYFRQTSQLDPIRR